MLTHEFKPQAAADEILRQSGKIDNLIPRLDDEEAARALLNHASELRSALGALESKAETLISEAEGRKSEKLKRFFDEPE